MKKTIFTLIFGFVLSLIGSFILVFEVMNINYHDEKPNTIIMEKAVYTYKLDKNVYVSPSYEIIIDNSIKEDELKVEVEYYKDYFDLVENEYDSAYKKDLDYYLDTKINAPFKMLKIILKDLKNNDFYNYTYFSDMNVKIYVNEKSYSKIKASEGDYFLRDETTVCPEMLEEIARNDEYVYYLNCVKSGTVFLIFDDGRKISIKTALLNEEVTIDELIEKGLEVHMEKISLQ